VLLLQGSADADGVVKDKNVSPEIQQRFAASYQAAGGTIQLELWPGARTISSTRPDRTWTVPWIR